MKPHQTPTILQPMLCWDGSVVTSDAVLLRGLGEGFAPPFPHQSRIRICSRGALILRSEEMPVVGDMRMYLRG